MSISLKSLLVGVKTAKNALSGVEVSTSKVHVGNANYEDTIPENSVDITIGVFIDGTLNNRDNSKARLAYEKAQYFGRRLPSDAENYEWLKNNTEQGLRDSYENDLSNVARMEAAYKYVTEGKRLQDVVYTEGIGTMTGGEDDKDGMGFGTGPTGIPKKVEKACGQVAEKIIGLFKILEQKKLTGLVLMYSALVGAPPLPGTSFTRLRAASVRP